MENYKVSVIIRSYNEQEKIGLCLSSIFNQEYKNFEVIIVDSGSTDKTLEIVKKFPVRIVSIKKSEFTYGRALNIGCQNAVGEYLVFLSAHAIPVDNKWLQNLTNDFTNPKVAGIYGKEVPAEDCNPLTRRQMESHWKEIKMRQTNNCFFSAANCAVRKNLWEQFNFDESMSASEDHKWAKTVQKNGFSIIYEPKAIVIHSHNENFKQIFNMYYTRIYGLLCINEINHWQYLSLGVYYICKDTSYILKNGYNYSWIVVSVINNILLELAYIKANIYSELNKLK